VACGETPAVGSLEPGVDEPEASPQILPVVLEIFLNFRRRHGGVAVELYLEAVDLDAPDQSTHPHCLAWIAAFVKFPETRKSTLS
jgi:hypothetical protein